MAAAETPSSRGSSYGWVVDTPPLPWTPAPALAVEDKETIPAI
jgi:hypothetical protein